MPINPNLLNDADIDIAIDEIANCEDFEKSDTEIETFHNVEELQKPQVYDDEGIIILDNLKEKKMNDPRVQAMFERSRHNIVSVLIISQGYYELPKRTI